MLTDLQKPRGLSRFPAHWLRELAEGGHLVEEALVDHDPDSSVDASIELRARAVKPDAPGEI
jgi:hypothetical protein